MRQRRPSKKRVTTRSDDDPGTGSRPNTTNPTPLSAGAELEQLDQRGELPEFIKRLLLFANGVSGLTDGTKLQDLVESAFRQLGHPEERLIPSDSLFEAVAKLLKKQVTHTKNDDEGGDR